MIVGGFSCRWRILDLSKGFHQLPLHPESRAKTAMNLGGNRYQWRVMPMGIKNGPAILQKIMDHVLQGLDCGDVYIDDIIIGSAVETEELLANHDRNVRAVLDRLRKEESVASVSKTDFFVHSVEFCGHVLENGTCRPAPGKMLFGGRTPRCTSLNYLQCGKTLEGD